MLTGASGFFFLRNERLFFVTSRHVVIDAPTKHFPNRVEIELHTDAVNLTQASALSVWLYVDGKSMWRQGQDTGGEIDVAAIELDRSALPPSVAMQAFTPAHLQSMLDEVEVGSALLVVGYPLAEALLTLIDADGEPAEQRAGAVVQAFAEHFDFHWTTVLRLKLGLDDASGGDRALADDYLTLLRRHRIDFTLAFARLADAAQGNNTPLRTLFGGAAAALELWLKRWRERTLAIGKSPDELAAALRSANPIYIPRNHHVESALAAAVERDDLAPFERLLRVLQHPFDEHAADSALAEPAPAEQTENYRTFCGT